MAAATAAPTRMFPNFPSKSAAYAALLLPQNIIYLYRITFCVFLQEIFHTSAPCNKWGGYAILNERDKEAYAYENTRICCA